MTAGCWRWPESTAALSVFTGYQALALIAAAAGLCLAQGPAHLEDRCCRWLLPVLAFGAYALYSLERYDALPRFKHARGLSLEGSSVLGAHRREPAAAGRRGGIPALSGGRVLPARTALAAAAADRRRSSWRFAVLLTPPSATSRRLRRSCSPCSWPPAVMVAASVSSESGMQLVNAVKRRPVDTDFVFLAFWFLVMMSAVTLLLPHATAKYLLPFLAPLVLLFFREMEAGIKSVAIVTSAGCRRTGPYLCAGTAVSSADNQLAQTYKDFALGFRGAISA